MAGRVQMPCRMMRRERVTSFALLIGPGQPGAAGKRPPGRRRLWLSSARAFQNTDAAVGCLFFFKENFLRLDLRLVVMCRHEPPFSAEARTAARCALRQENRSGRKTGLGGMEVAKPIQGCRPARTALRQAGSETARAAPVWA
jgi:hypothetical protein